MAQIAYEKTLTALHDPYNDDGEGRTSYSDREMHAALDVDIPNYASAIVTTNEIIDANASL